MSRDLGRDVPDLEKLYARKLWADFSYPSLKTFISCYRTPRPQKGFQKGFLKGSLKGFRRVLEGFRKGSAEDPSKTLPKPF